MRQFGTRLIFGSAFVIAGCSNVPAKTAPPPETVTVTTPTGGARESSETATNGATAKNGDSTPPAGQVPHGDGPERVRLGAITINGSRNVEAVGQRVLREMSKVRACHEQVLADGRAPAGWLRVKLLVARDGRVRSATKQAPSSMDDDTLTRCVMNTFSRVRFGESSNGYDQEITTVIYFTR